MSNREHSESNNSAAITALNQGDVDRAVALLRRATAEDPTDAQPFATLGMALAMRGQYGEALDSLQKSYDLHPANETLLSTGIVYFLDHDYDAAINAWNKALQANPELCNVYGPIGMAYLHKGDLDQASENFKRMVKCSPGCDLGYFGEALTNFLRGDLRTSEEQGERALSINKYPPTMLLLCAIDALQGDVSRCRKRATELTHMTSHRFQQRTMTELGYPSQHDFHFDPFITDNFDNGYLVLARLTGNTPNHQAYLAWEGKIKAAIDRNKTALGHAPNDLFLTRQLGYLQWASGDYSSSADSWEKALKLCPTCNVDLLHLGRTLAADGKTDVASDKVRQFQKKEPSQEIAPDFSQTAKVDPALQYEHQTHKQVQTLQQEPPKQTPSTEF